MLEVIQTFERVSNTSLNYKIVPRRAGDITAAYADTTKVNTDLGWKSVSTLDDAIKSAWNWENKLKK